MPQTEKHKQIQKKTHLHPFQVFSVVTCLGNKPANTKSNGTIYKGIVKVKANARVQSFFCWIKALGSKITNSTNWCVLMPVLPKTFQTSGFCQLPLFVVDSQKCATTAASNNFYGRLKIQATTVLYRYFESRQCRVRVRERKRKRKK